MPTTSPRMLNSGPPELPGLMGTSVWMNGTYPESSVRPLALTMPAVALFSKPNGAPIASTHSPTLSPRESPILTVGRSLAGMRRIAISDFGSTPTTLAMYSRRSVRRTVTSLAPSTTCALVMMTPSARTMNPEPSPRIGCGCGIWNGRPRKNGANGLLGPNGLLPLGLSLGLGLLSSELSSPWELQEVDTLLTTVTLTTAGPYFCTMLLKSGSIVAGLAAAGAGVTGLAAAAAVLAALGIAALLAAVATARVSPARYRAPAGTAMVTAPRMAARSGFLDRLGRLMAVLRQGWGLGG